MSGQISIEEYRRRILQQQLSEPAYARQQGIPRQMEGENIVQASDQHRHSDALTLRVITINDVYDLELLPRFATAVQKLKTSTTVVLLPGDFLSPSLLSSLDKGHGMVDCLNSCGVQYVCFGNHEQDIPFPQILKRMEESNFLWINTNMPDYPIPKHLQARMPKFVTFEIGSQSHRRKIGLLGLNTDDAGLYQKTSFEGSCIHPVDTTADTYAKILYDQEKCDLVIPMTHQVMAKDRAFCKRFTGDVFPLVLGGHDHDLYHEEICGSTILKMGMDARMVGVCDLSWPSADDPGRKIQLDIQKN